MESITLKYNLDQAYIKAENFARSHYENFPVVSFLIRKDLRKHVAVIYWFARTADDMADEGNVSPEERIKHLNFFENRFTETLEGNYKEDMDYALHQTIITKKLSSILFYDLLAAFKQDVSKSRYEDFDEILEYCRCSANPVGRLMLELYGISNDNVLSLSDKVCTALQLTNFYQDISIDYNKGRIYLAEDEMLSFGVTEKNIEEKNLSQGFVNLMKKNVERADAMFDEGKALLRFLDRRLKYEINWTILGGKAILEKIKKSGFDVLNYRPVLTKKDFAVLLIKAVTTN